MTDPASPSTAPVKAVPPVSNDAALPAGIMSLGNNRFIVDFKTIEFDSAAKAELTSYINRLGLDKAKDIQLITPDDIRKLPFDEQVKIWGEIRRSSEDILIQRYLEIPNNPVDASKTDEIAALKKKFGLGQHDDIPVRTNEHGAKLTSIDDFRALSPELQAEVWKDINSKAGNAMHSLRHTSLHNIIKESSAAIRESKPFQDYIKSRSDITRAVLARHADALAKWEDMYPSKREKLLETICADLAKECGMPEVKPDFQERFSPGEGGYDYNKKVIMLPVPENGAAGIKMTHLNVAIHEFMHAEQDHLVQQLKEGKIKPGDPNYELAKLLDENQKAYVNPADQSASRDASAGKRYYSDLNDAIAEVEQKGGDPTKHLTENLFENMEVDGFKLYQIQPLESSVCLIAEGVCIDHIVAGNGQDSSQTGGEKKLTVSNANISTLVVEYLLASPHMKDVKALDLKGNFFGDHGIVALASSPVVSQLRALDLENTTIMSRGIKVLAASPHFSNLEELNLKGNFIDDDGAKYLAQSPNLKNLKNLNLEGNHITEAGAKALAESPHLSPSAKVSALMSTGHREMAEAIIKQHPDAAHASKPGKAAEEQAEGGYDDVQTRKNKKAEPHDSSDSFHKRNFIQPPAPQSAPIAGSGTINPTGAGAPPADPAHTQTTTHGSGHANPNPTKPSKLPTLGHAGNRGLGIAGTATGTVEGIATGDPTAIATSAIDVADTASDLIPATSRTGQVLRGIGTIGAPLAIVGGVTQMADGVSRMGDHNTAAAGVYNFGLGGAGATAGVATLVGGGGLASTIGVILLPVALVDYGIQRVRGNAGNDDSKPWETSMTYALRWYDEASAVKTALSKEGVNGSYYSYAGAGYAPPLKKDYIQLRMLEVKEGESIEDAIERSRKAANDSWQSAYERVGNNPFFADYKDRLAYDSVKDQSLRRLAEMDAATKEYKGEPDKTNSGEFFAKDYDNPHAGQIQIGRSKYADSFQKREKAFESAKKAFEDAGPRSQQTWNSLQDTIAVTRELKPSEATAKAFEAIKKANDGKELTVDQKLGYISNQALYTRAMDIAKEVQSGKRTLQELLAEDQKTAALLKDHGPLMNHRMSEFHAQSLLITSEEKLETIARYSWESQRKLAIDNGQDPDKIVAPSMKEAFGIESPLFKELAGNGTLSEQGNGKTTLTIVATKGDAEWLRTQGIEGQLDGKTLKLDWDKVKDKLPKDVSDKLVKTLEATKARTAQEARIRQQADEQKQAEEARQKAEAAADKVAEKRIHDVLNVERADAYRQIIRTMHAEKPESFQITEAKDKEGKPNGKLKLSISGRKGYDFDQLSGGPSTEWVRNNPDGHVIDQLMEQRNYSDVSILKGIFSRLERENFPDYTANSASTIMYYDESQPDTNDGRGRRRYGNTFNFELDPANPDHMKGLAKLLPEDVYNQVLPPELLKQHPYPKGVKWEFEERYELLQRLKTEKVTPASFDRNGDGKLDDKEKSDVARAHRMLNAQARINPSLADVVKQVAEVAKAHGVELVEDKAEVRPTLTEAASSIPERPYNAPYYGR